MKIMTKTTGKAERDNSVKGSISQAKHQKLLLASASNDQDVIDSQKI